MPRYLSPKSDLIFKKIFAEHPHLLKSFLNAILPLPDDSLIETLEYLPTENIPEIPNFKYSIVDVRCKDQHGNQFIVEMQLQWSKYFIQRMIYNTASSYVRQLNKGESYRELSPVYGLAIIDALFDRNAGKQEWFHHYRLSNAADPEKYFRDMQLVLIELPKIEPTTIMEKKLAILWLRFLKEIGEDTAEIDPSFIEAAPIKEALSLVESASFTPEELENYERNWDSIRSEITLIEDNRAEALQKGRKQGLKEGVKKGKKEGLKEGHKKGVEEGHKKGVEEGHKKGVEEGHKKGVELGKVEFFKKLLQKRFDKKAFPYFARIETATSTSLEKWMLQAIDAKEVEEIFES